MEKTKLGKRDIFTSLKEKDKQISKSISKQRVPMPFPNEQKKRQTYHMHVDSIPRIREYAYFERYDISDVVNMAVDKFLKGYKPKMKR